MLGYADFMLYSDRRVSCKRQAQKLCFSVVKWWMFLIAARFALSFGGDTWIQPEFLEGSSCKLELHFKSKIILTNLEKSF